ncbi:MAG: type II secretion system F family protein [Planctomycetota bacterium]|jgi:type IV pilus assembly protein PilC|nr:type II secretion system F family protein [Planctomycetota bacterium]
MPVFQYEAMDSRGQEVRAEVEAVSQEEAITKIRALGQFPTQVRAKARKGPAAAVAGPKKKARAFAIGRINAKQLTQFTRQMSTLQDAGLPILRSLRILEGQTKPGVLKNSLMDIIEDVEAGSTLSEAMEKHPKAFDRLYVCTVRAGEAGGVLDQILRKLAEFMEKAQALRRRIVGAMVYPAMVIGVAVLIVSLIMVFIVPKFEEIFLRFEIKSGLPAPTKLLIAISHALYGYWYLIPLIPFSIWLGMRSLKATNFGRFGLDWIKMKIPIVGSIVGRQAIAKFSRTLGTLITAGVPILEALNITRETVGNEVVSRALLQVHDSIREGESIAGPLRTSGVVDPIVVNMVDVGEETGELDKMLIKVADTYDEEVDHLVGSLVNAMEPIMIIFLGGTIGFIVISLFLPLVDLIKFASGKK